MSVYLNGASKEIIDRLTYQSLVGNSGDLESATRTIAATAETDVTSDGANLLAALNPGFETAGAGGVDVWASWNEQKGVGGAIADEAVIFHGGAHSAKLSTIGADDTYITSANTTVVAGKEYKLTFWTYGDAANVTRFKIYDVTNAANIIALTSTGLSAASWNLFTVTFTTPALCVSINIELRAGSVNGSIGYFDDVAVVNNGPDYTSGSLTVTAPSDVRFVVTRIGVRLSVTVDSWAGGGTTLNYRIRRGATSIGTGTLTAASGTGALTIGHDVTSGTLTGGAVYTVYLWVNSGSCIVSVSNVWVGCGSTGSADADCFKIVHKGWVHLRECYATRIGSSNLILAVSDLPSSSGGNGQDVILAGAAAATQYLPAGTSTTGVVPILSSGNLYFYVNGTTPDLSYIQDIGAVLRTEV